MRAQYRRKLKNPEMSTLWRRADLLQCGPCRLPYVSFGVVFRHGQSAFGGRRGWADLAQNIGRTELPARKPAWLRMERQGGAAYNGLKTLLRSQSLHTVCESANCPNRGECFANRTATFMIMGDVCSRKCSFCALMPRSTYHR